MTGSIYSIHYYANCKLKQFYLHTLNCKSRGEANAIQSLFSLTGEPFEKHSSLSFTVRFDCLSESNMQKQKVFNVYCTIGKQTKIQK